MNSTGQRGCTNGTGRKGRRERKAGMGWDRRRKNEREGRRANEKGQGIRKEGK
jgi:hypothetical protein